MKLSEIAGLTSNIESLPQGIAGALKEAQKIRAIDSCRAAIEAQDNLRSLVGLSSAAIPETGTVALSELQASTLEAIVGQASIDETSTARAAYANDLASITSMRANATQEILSSTAALESVRNLLDSAPGDTSTFAAAIGSTLRNEITSLVSKTNNIQNITAAFRDTLATPDYASLARAAGARFELAETINSIERTMPRGLASAFQALQNDSAIMSARWHDHNTISIDQEHYEAEDVFEWLQTLPYTEETESDFWDAIWERSKQLSTQYGRTAQTLFLMIISQIITKILWTYIVYPTIESALEFYSSAPSESQSVIRIEDSSDEKATPQIGPPQ